MLEYATRKQKIGLAVSFASLVLLGFFVLLVLLMFFNTSFGWFVNNKNVSASGAEVEVEYDDFHVAATYYYFNPRSNAVESSSDLTNINFNPYDLVFRTRNRYTPVVAAIKMTGNDLSENGTVSIRLSRDTDKVVFTTDQNDLKHMPTYFTSIMRVTPFVGASYYSATDTTLYNNIDTISNYTAVSALTGDQPSTQSQVFTTVTMNGDYIDTVTKDDYLDFVIDYTSSDFVTIDGTRTLIVYLYITYDEGYLRTVENGVTTTEYNGLVGTYQKTSEAQSISAGTDITETSVKFENDLTMILAAHS